jgi:hypothetical protein
MTTAALKSECDIADYFRLMAGAARPGICA